MSEHSEILTRLDFVPDHLDYGAGKPNSGSFFSVHIPAKKLWVDRSRWKRGAMSFFTELSINFSFRLPEYCSVFQIEVGAIREAVDLLLRWAASLREVTIPSKSWTTILELTNCAFRAGYGMPNLVIKGSESLCDKTCVVVRSQRNWWQLQSWWAGKEGYSSPAISRMGTNRCSRLLVCSLKFGHHWAPIDSCVVVRSFWPKIYRKRFSELFALSQTSSCLVVGVLTVERSCMKKDKV